jgi:hypothetical protein
MIDHITYHVPPGTLADPALKDFMSLLGFEEIEPNDPFEHGWNVRWWRVDHDTDADRRRTPAIHLVEGEVPSRITPYDRLCLGHFCVKKGSGWAVTDTAVAARAKGWLERDSDSGRIWLAFANLRIEVRP